MSLTGAPTSLATLSSPYCTGTGVGGQLYIQ
jgi:hypothetical protein